MKPIRPPGPPQSWIGGSFSEFRRDLLGFFTRCAREYGDIVWFRLARRPCVLINHPDLIESVLVKHSKQVTKHFGLQLARGVLGNGLLTSEGSFWLRQRRMAAPAFHADRIATYAPDMLNATQQRLSTWQDGERLDIHKEMMQLTLDIAAKTLFGADVGEDSREVDRALRVALEGFATRISSMIPLPAWFPSSSNRAARASMSALNQVVGNLIEQRRHDDRERHDLLSILLRARDEDDGTGMTDAQLADEARTFLLAGHETTALTLSWSMHLLATHPGVQELLRAELSEVLGDRAPQASDLPQLKLAERVVLEAMRLYPPAFVIGRQPTEDFELGGYQIPAGTTIFMSQWVMHRDERFFPRAESFEPQRWESAAQIPKMAYFPFGGGPRVCIGNTFAMMESVLVLAAITQRYWLASGETGPVALAPLFTLRPRNGIHLVLSKERPVKSTDAARPGGGHPAVDPAHEPTS